MVEVEKSEKVNARIPKAEDDVKALYPGVSCAPLDHHY
jgi:hypothetical protein